MKKVLFALLAATALSGCLKGNDNATFTCSYNECAVVAPAAEIQQVKDYLTANNINTATQHCSGLFYTIDDPGTGAAPTPCSYIAFTYEGKLTDGTVFDKSTQPVSSSLSGLIRGFQNGLPKIKAGGRMHLYVPPTLGYGSNANGPVPANSVLIFDVTLVGVQ
jgi:FKBP-type peptidyl-prolyl cis-trans isomerase FkpA